jgi:hypothetical protein
MNQSKFAVLQRFLAILCARFVPHRAPLSRSVCPSDSAVENSGFARLFGNSVCRRCARFLKQQLRRIPIKHPIRNALRSGFLYCEARLARRSRAHDINRGRIKVPGVSPPAGQHLLAGWHKINGRPAGPRAAPRKDCADHELNASHAGLIWYMRCICTLPCINLVVPVH